MKKTVLSLLAILGASSVFARVDYYVGAGVGVNQFVAKRNVSVTNAGDLRILNEDNAGTGFMGDLFLGARVHAEPYFVAGEIGGELSQAEITATDSNYLYNFGLSSGLKIRKHGTLRLSVLPGMNISDKTDGFLRLGYARTRFSFASTNGTGGDFIPDGEVKKTLSGYVLGAGMETALTNTVRTRLEYLFSHYQAIDIVGAGANKPGVESVVTRIRPIDHAVVLSLVMNFSV